MVKTKRRPDRRIAKTKAAIAKAFEELLLETDFDKITITAIAKRADIDRKTFYAHYASVSDLLEEMTEQSCMEIAEGVDFKHFFDDPLTNTNTIFKNLNAHLEANLPANQRMVHIFPIEQVTLRWLNPVKEKIIENAGITSAAEQAEVEFLLDYYIGGTVALYTSWLKSDMKVPIEAIAKIASHSSVYGLSSITIQKNQKNRGLVHDE